MSLSDFLTPMTRLEDQLPEYRDAYRQMLGVWAAEREEKASKALLDAKQAGEARERERREEARRRNAKARETIAAKGKVTRRSIETDALMALGFDRQEAGNIVTAGWCFRASRAREAGATLKQIGDGLGISRERTRQLANRAERMKKAGNTPDWLFSAYLGEPDIAELRRRTR